MDPDEVIVIEDTPPTSPVKNTNQKQQPIDPLAQEDMYYQPQNGEFPVGEQAIIWLANTTNFIKESMTSVKQNNQVPLLNNNVQNKPVAPVNMGTHLRPILPRNGVRNYPTPPYNIYNLEQYAKAYSEANGYAPNGNSTYLNNFDKHNFWMKVKLEEVPDKGEIVSQYYIDDTETPVKMNTDQNENSVPEFIDINSLADKIPNQQTTRFVTETTEESVTLSTETDDKKKNKNSVPLFLKRNRPITNIKMKIPDDEENNNSFGKEDNNDDVIFIGEYKHEKIPDKTESNESQQTGTIQPQQSYKEEVNEAEKYNSGSKYSYKFGQRKRKDRNSIPLRRNPKRQVQIEKEFLKMIDDVIMECDKEEKQKKNPGYKQSKPAKPAIKNCRRSPRVMPNSGAVYRPPSPLTTAHMRDWPAEGMHERPEYDPVSGKIQPFDRFISNIPKKSNEPNTNEQFVLKNNMLSESLETKKSFPELCHEMLHHVIAYIATVKDLERHENSYKENNTDKEQFLQHLALTKSEDNVENKVCDILQSIVSDVTEMQEKQKKEDKTNALADLLKNTILIYCLTNNVDMSDVAKYIASVKPADIIKLSNEKFQIFPEGDN